ncbi:tumor protein p63-regulated gene 1 protein [Hippocampus comes]|uniref:tumor protein p63-regulated gene 1 protein n=1 Tax=Hippocampus comes TaxID=109280 RepID=UPI00094E8842|nr:PREDICTED: tumor protein p63-regulated gene 1-like protein [Hippocampus comes]
MSSVGTSMEETTAAAASAPVPAAAAAATEMEKQSSTKAEEPATDCGVSRCQFGDPSGEPPLSVNQFKCKKFFVLRPGTLHQAIKEVKVLVDPQVDGNILGIWLLAEVDHWNNEKERLVVITDTFLLVCKYDFMMFQCEQIQKIPLNMVDRICYGSFTFPPNSVLFVTRILHQPSFGLTKLFQSSDSTTVTRGARCRRVNAVQTRRRKSMWRVFFFLFLPLPSFWSGRKCRAVTWSCHLAD